MDERRGPSVPLLDALAGHLDRLCRALQDALEDRMVAAILYGSAACGDYAPRSSDVNLLIVVDVVDTDMLDRVAPIFRRTRRRIALAPLLISHGELRRSADVFPTKFLAIQRCHRLLLGRDVLSDLRVSSDHLRLRCEQELRNLELRLRRTYLLGGPSGRPVTSALTQALPVFLSNLSVVLELATGQPTDQAAQVLERVGELGIDGRPLRDISAMKQRRHRPGRDELRDLHDAFVQQVCRAIDIVDGLGEA